VITDGSTTLANGVRNITARRTPSGGSQSAASPLLAITIDTVAPSLVGGTPTFHYETAPHGLIYTFSEDVGPTLGVGDFAVQQLPSTNANVSLSYDGGSDTATLTFNGFANGVLTDGQYNAVLSSAGVTDVAGNALTSNSDFNFFFLLGDANHDGFVNLQDFNILAANFGALGTSYPQADFNYDGQTNLADFNILASQFGAAVAPAGRPGALFGGTPIGSKSADDSTDERIELLA
jgi:hypothetical protein